MWLFKKNPFKCKYIEFTWDYPVPANNPMIYKHRFTNKPQDCDRSMGNGGRGYLCFDLDNQSDLNKIARLNYGYKKQNCNTMYVEQDVITLCFDINKQRGVNK